MALAIALILPSGSGGATAAASSAGTETGRPIVIGQSYNLPSRILGNDRVINVYLPEGYRESSRTFPVLFLLDGGEHEDFLHIAGLAQINAAYGQGQELIVVGVEGVDRRRDLTSPSSVAADLKVAPTSGGASDYREFLIRELKPWVESRYRTNGRTGIIGESLAGLFVLNTFLTQPQSFSDYISVSPSLWWNGGSIARHAALELQQHDYRGKRIWIAFDAPAPPADAAAKDLARQRRLEQAFRAGRARGLTWKIVHAEEGHATIYHPAAVEAFRAFYGPGGR